MSQKTDKMLKLALVFFVSLLSFSIGTFVGKKYSDNQHKLSQLEPQKNSETNSSHDFATTNSAEVKSESAKTTPEQLLTDNEVAKIAEEFATDTTDSDIDSPNEKNIPVTESEAKDIKEITVGKTPVTAKPLAPAVASSVTKTTAVPKPATNAAQIQTTIEKIKKMETREVASILPSNRYTVQVGSFPTQAEADKLSGDLINKGYKASAVSAQVNGQTWFRVHVGLFPSVKEAQDYKKGFLEKTKLSSAIVQRVQK